MTSPQMESWKAETLKSLRKWNCHKLADKLEKDWNPHEHEYLSAGTLERLDRKSVVVLYQCALCDDEITEIQELPRSEWEQEE